MNETLESLKTLVSGRYSIESEIGSGGMATVYLAQDLKHSRQVAIKVLRADIVGAISAERFLREIKVTAGLQHPHILPLFDSGSSRDIIYYVMPYVAGESLRERLVRERQLTLDESVRIVRDVGSALGYSHDRQVIHRDIKPENILFSGSELVVMDFGIAQAVDVAGHYGITETGIVLGTPLYMSPEQATGSGHLDSRTDQYSLACVLYEMLAGEPPFTGASNAAIIARHCMDPPRSLESVRPDIPLGVSRVLRKALAKSPADRYSSVGDFVSALTTASAAAAPILKPRRGLGVLARAAIGTLVLAGIGAGLWYWRIHSSPVPAKSDRPMVAVLPWSNLSAPENETFADGITVEFTNRLATIPGIRVVAYASASRYKKPNNSLSDIAHALGVDYVLTGSVRADRKSDGTTLLRLSPELIRVRDEQRLWAEQYDAPLVPGQMLALQETMAQRVCEAVGVAIPMVPAAAKEPTTRNTAAYQYYLRGLAAGARPFDELATQTASEMYKKAVELDPAFALAWARLSITQSLSYFSYNRTPATFLVARHSLDRALQLDPTLSETHLAAGTFYLRVTREFSRAREELTRVLQAQPNNSEVLWLVSTLERRQLHWDRSIILGREAADLDPRSQLYAFDLGVTHEMQRWYDEADRYYDRAIAVAPDWIPPYLAKSFLAIERNGDVVRSRQILASATAHVDIATILAVAIPTSREHVAVMGSAFQDKLARLSLASGIDSSWFYIAKGDLYARRADPRIARTYYDSARATVTGRLATRGGEPSLHTQLGLALAGLGQGANAIQEGQKAVDFYVRARDELGRAQATLRLAEIQVAASDYDGALENLRLLLIWPWGASPAQLRVHPDFAALRPLPRFERLLREFEVAN